MRDPESHTPQTFGQLFMEEMHRLAGGRFRFDTESFSIHHLDKGSITNLSNFYEEYTRLNTADREGYIQGLARTITTRSTELPADFSVACQNLRPKLWLRFSIEVMQYELGNAGQDPVMPPYVPVGEHLCLVVVYDTETSMQSIPLEQLNDWGISFYEAMEIALQNLQSTTSGYASLGENIIHFIDGDSYDSSRIMLLELIKSKSFNGSPVALIPDRNTVFIADGDDPKSLEIIYVLTANAMDQADRPLMALPLMLVDDEWVDWVPPADHPIRSSFDRFRLEFFSSIYGGQQQLLNANYELQGINVFVAAYGVLKSESDGAEQSYCSWAEDVESLLPKTDLIAFIDQSSEIRLYDWDQVEATCGNLLALEPGLYPPRYRVSQFPSEEQFAALEE